MNFVVQEKDDSKDLSPSTKKQEEEVVLLNVEDKGEPKSETSPEVPKENSEPAKKKRAPRKKKEVPESKPETKLEPKSNEDKKAQKRKEIIDSLSFVAARKKKPKLARHQEEAKQNSGGVVHPPAAKKVESQEPRSEPSSDLRLQAKLRSLDILHTINLQL